MCRYFEKTVAAIMRRLTWHDRFQPWGLGWESAPSDEVEADGKHSAQSLFNTLVNCVWVMQWKALELSRVSKIMGSFEA